MLPEQLTSLGTIACRVAVESRPNIILNMYFLRSKWLSPRKQGCGHDPDHGVREHVRVSCIMLYTWVVGHAAKWKRVVAIKPAPACSEWKTSGWGGQVNTEGQIIRSFCERPDEVSKTPHGL